LLRLAHPETQTATPDTSQKHSCRWTRLLSIAIACIPVLIVCWIIKVIPDIDYSIRVAFVFMLGSLIYQLLS
ncbi:MAG: hypothetical protein AAF242_21545, partial [Bacteroidota bacterium]